MGTEINKKLRVGLLMDSFDIPYWAYVMLEKIADSRCCKIELIVLNVSAKKRRNLLEKIITNYNRLLYVVYWKFENKLHKPCPDAFETKNADVLLKGIPVLKVKPRHIKYSDWMEDGDINKIKGYEIDVLVRLGFGILRGKILAAAKYGVWSYHHGDNTRYRGGPAGFWEVFENYPVAGSILQILTEDLDNGMVICRSYSSTDVVSVNYNRNKCHWKTLMFIPRKLEELYKTGEKAFFNKVSDENKGLGFYRSRLYTAPSNFEMLKLLVKYAARRAKDRMSRFFYFQQWCLMFDLRGNLSTSFWRFKRIVPPNKGVFWADPCVVYKDNKYYIFIEEFVCKTSRGRISLIVMDEKGKYDKPVTVLERDYHLSHPFIFEWNGAYYMVPETASNKKIEIYKCLKFPDRWKFEKVLMQDVSAYDPTLFRCQQKWWLYASIVENKGASSDDELFLFSSDSPLSDSWLPHPKNPIVSDVRRARPAGKIFEYNGQIYRPSQDCSIRYGYSVRINKILRLNETEYEETEIDYIEPTWCKGIKGVHSFVYERGLTVIDVLAKRSRLKYIFCNSYRRI